MIHVSVYMCRKKGDIMKGIHACIASNAQYITTNCCELERPHINDELVRRDRVHHKKIMNYDRDVLQSGQYLMKRNCCSGSVIYEFDSTEPFENKKLQIVDNLTHKYNHKKRLRYQTTTDYIIYDGVKISPTKVITTNRNDRGTYCIIEK